MAERIREAHLVELPGEDHLWWFGDQDAIVDEVEEFLTGARSSPEADRVLATVMFTDIVASTELGDRRWRAQGSAGRVAALRRHRVRGLRPTQYVPCWTSPFAAGSIPRRRKPRSSTGSGV
jgi:hypothetical protein